MTRIQQFEELIAWQKAKKLTVLNYKLFKTSRDFAFKDQTQRASVSVMNNIAEGFERNSNKELRNFMYIAKGSCGEVRSMLILAQELNYLTDEEFQKAHDLSMEVIRLISGFIKRIEA